MGKLRRSWPKASPAGKRLNKWWRNYMRSRGLGPLLPARRAMSRCGLDPPHRLRVATVNSLCELTVVFLGRGRPRDKKALSVATTTLR